MVVVEVVCVCVGGGGEEGVVVVAVVYALGVRVGACFERLILELLLMSCFPRITSSSPVIQFKSVLSIQKKKSYNAS